MLLGSMKTRPQTRLFVSMSTHHHSVDLLTARSGVPLVVHGTSSSTISEMIPTVPLETSGGVLSAADRDATGYSRRRLKAWFHDKIKLF